LALTIVHVWHTTKQIDYVLAYPQVPVRKEFYMQIPKGFMLEGNKNPKDYVLKLHENVYRQKQAGDAFGTSILLSDCPIVWKSQLAS
jgi:hypothetical protein